MIGKLLLGPERRGSSTSNLTMALSQPAPCLNQLIADYICCNTMRDCQLLAMMASGAITSVANKIIMVL